MTSILQAPLLREFLYPMLLIFFITFAILQKTEIFGKEKSQINAMISLIVSLIFVGAVFPKMMTTHLIEYMAIAMIVIFVGLFLWGFISGNKDLTITDDKGKKIHKIFVFLIFGGLTFVILWASGLGTTILSGFMKISSFIFGESTSEFWTNALLIGIILFAIFVALGKSPNFKTDPWIKLK